MLFSLLASSILLCFCALLPAAALVWQTGLPAGLAAPGLLVLWPGELWQDPVRLGLSALCLGLLGIHMGTGTHTSTVLVSDSYKYRRTVLSSINVQYNRIQYEL